MESPRSSSLATSAVAKVVLGVIKARGSLHKQKKDKDEPTLYAERVCENMNSPFVKSTFRLNCGLVHKDHRPMALLKKANSMAELFREAVKLHGMKACLGFRNKLGTQVQIRDGKPFRQVKQGVYQFHSYETIDDLVEMYARGFLSLGLQPKQKVALLAETCMEWMCIAQALMRYNITLVTLYATLSENGVIHGLRETEATTLVVSQEILERMHKTFEDLPHLQNIIYLEGMEAPSVTVKGKYVINVFELRLLGRAYNFSGAVEGPTKEDTAILMYTSGSTGVPKAVILTHGNMLSAARGLGEAFESLKVREDDSYVAYLPLAHVFELSCEMIAILYGVKIGYSSANTLTDSSTMVIPGEHGDCTLLRPTIMASVPLVLDRVKKSVLDKTAARGKLPLRVLELAVSEAVAKFGTGQDTSVLDREIFAKIRSVVGGRLRVVASGSAALSPATHAFIRATLGVTVIQGYGLTETCGAATCMDVTDLTTGGVGCPVGGSYVRLVDWPEGGYFVAQNKGEIILGGDMVAKGYYKNEELTKECFFEEDGIRWFRTGDIGEVLLNGTFKIIDRKKDLVKLQHGEYVSLGKVETELKTLNIIENICVYGSGLQTYIVALVQPNRKHLEALGAQLNKGGMPYEELVNDPDVTANVLSMLQAHAKSLKFLKTETPQKATLCPEEWTPDTELVTAAFKLRRKQIQEKYQEDIDRMCS